MGKKLKLKNLTKIRTVGNIVPDCWIYVQDRRGRLGRMQIYNNWLPYMVRDLKNTVWIGLEYFVQEVLDTHVERVRKAYPAYYDTYNEIDRLVEFLNGIQNLYCVGRNGQHRYNNIDHSMCTSFEAVKNILNGISDKTNVWNVNTEKEYHEGK